MARINEEVDRLGIFGVKQMSRLEYVEGSLLVWMSTVVLESEDMLDSLRL